MADSIASEKMQKTEQALKAAKVTITQRVQESLSDLRTAVQQADADARAFDADFAAFLKWKQDELHAGVEIERAELKAAGARAVASLKAQQEKAHARLDEQRARIDAANARMKAGLDARKAHSDATVAEWKARHEAQRLESRAADAQDYANAAIIVAAGAIDAAKAAILDAMTARADVEDAKRGSAAKK